MRLGQRGAVLPPLEKSEEQAIDYCRYYDNHHLEVVKGFFLNSIYKEWGMTFHQASARFILGRIPLIDRRRSHLVANPDDTDDERDAELARARAAEQAADVAPGDVSGKVNCWT